MLALKEIAEYLNVLYSKQQINTMNETTHFRQYTLLQKSREKKRTKQIHSNTISSSLDLMEQCTINKRCLQMKIMFSDQRGKTAMKFFVQVCVFCVIGNH